MASSSYSEDLICSICRSIFSDPVSLPCLHSFCRLCVSEALRTQSSCPQCRDFVPTRDRNLKTNHILNSLAARAQEEERRERIKMCCPEHEEKLRLFCETDQQLVCVICRDGQQHDGHKFKPIKEAAILMRAELENVVQFLTEDNKDIETMVTLQNEELRKTKEKHKQVQDQMQLKFEDIKEYIKRMEEEILFNLRKKENVELKKMTKTLKNLDSALSERKNIESKVKSAQDIAGPDSFLKMWNDEVRFEVKKLKCGQQTDSSFLSKAAGLHVTPAALYLLPHESYLLFSAWKEMLEIIKQTLANKSP